MAGVIRPYTLVDVLATINQNQGNQNATTGATGIAFGVIAEVDDPVTGIADSATATHSPPPGWDAGIWGATAWQ